MGCLIHPSYFPNLAQFSIILNTENVVFEVYDNYQKQTYRNRAEIYGANGKLTLTVPVIYSQKNRQLYKDVKIANDGNWQQAHLKSLQSAYRMSPFFEFYIDDLMPLFKDRFEYILDLNLKCFEILSSCLQLDLSIQFTECFEKIPTKLKDFRHLINRNSGVFKFQPYTQVFTEKHGFIANLSILDLLFNEGPKTELYLNEQSPI
ncbi:WbqC family protein [Winogradskyella alexanderae]|uniref:WbqC family protein n=1 Tax=Winogradskyella alexanderae TaxID=2877123 RepID=A0ABS7XQJ1_9FLAO|nr:WbqC family protein [Winogradskyella alexanderae]MCA0132260.1 WbqC family protein [Winogradskyella alexanderae]